jgi:hypothetical protein
MARALTRINAVRDQAATAPTADEANKTGKQMRLQCWLVLDAGGDGRSALWTNKHRGIGSEPSLLNNHCRSWKRSEISIDFLFTFEIPLTRPLRDDWWHVHGVGLAVIAGRWHGIRWIALSWLESLM